LEVSRDSGIPFRTPIAYRQSVGLAESMREVTKLPTGVRVTVVFLRVFCIATFFPALIACLAAMATLVGGSLDADLISGAVLISGATFGTFLAIMMMALGSDWLARHLKAAATMGPGWSTRFQRPIHPARQIFLPPLGCVMAYAFLAVLTWLPSTFQTPLDVTWPWPVTWRVIGFGAMYLFHILDEKLP
jgi:hypothetical protein